MGFTILAEAVHEATGVAFGPAINVSTQNGLAGDKPGTSFAGMYSPPEHRESPGRPEPTSIALYHQMQE